MVSFKDFTPPAVETGIFPFQYADIWESASPDGPWSKIDSWLIDPQDEDASHPATRSFDTKANLIEGGGWYKIIWRNADNVQAGTPPVQDLPPDAYRYLPTASDVGKILMTRTADKSGKYVGTFTMDTQPSIETVFELIIQAGDDVNKAIGDDIPPDLWDDAKRIVALRAALLIELGYDRERGGSSTYDRLERLYQAQIQNLVTVVASREEELDIDNTTLTGNMPSFNFPTGPGIGTARW